MSKSKMRSWNSQLVSEQFQNQALQAEQYLREVRVKVKSNKSYESIYDEQLARFYVFDYLHVRAFIDSRVNLVAGLNNLLANENTSWADDSYDKQRFEQFRAAFVKSLIQQFEPDCNSLIPPDAS